MARPVVPCCTPYKAAYGSGHHWTHSRWCPEYPNQKVGQERAHPAGQGRDPDRLPVRGGFDGFVSWNRSPLIGPMDYWAAYFDHHVDDEAGDRPVPEGQDA